MPTYDYRCTACQHQEERFLPISKAPSVISCPRCSKRAFRKTITGAAVTAGTVIPGCRVQYPVANFQLPVEPGQQSDTVVMSRQHLRELCAKHDYRVDQY